MFSRVLEALFWLAVCLHVQPFLACRPSNRGAAIQPNRIVCLTPSVTEIVGILGATDRIVGVDQFSTIPEVVRSLPKVGDFLSPNMDAILALHPDIVVLDAVQVQVIAGLNAAGVRTVAPRMQNVEDIRAAILLIGESLGQDVHAKAAVGHLDEELAKAMEVGSRALSYGRQRPRVLFVVDRQVGGLGSIVAAGPGTYIDDLLHRAGGQNVLADSPVAYTKLSAEEIISWAPEVIFDAVHTGDKQQALADWKALSSVPAVKSSRVYVLGDTLFVSPGPRLGQALGRLATLLWESR